MIASGVLHENHRVELLEGWIVAKMPHNPPHDGMIDILVGGTPMLPDAGFPRIQSAITTADSEPEPDIAIVRGPRKRYIEKHPGGSDVGFIVEIADSSLQHDRSFKASLYGRAGIGTYWIVNIPDSGQEIGTVPVASLFS